MDFFFFLIVWLVPFGLGLLAIIMHFSSCKSINAKAILPPPSLNSLNCLPFMSRKRIDFPSCPPHRIKGHCLYSVLETRWGLLYVPEALQPYCQPQSTCLLLQGPCWFPSLFELCTLGLYCLALPNGVFQAAILCSRSEFFLQAPLVGLFISSPRSCLPCFTLSVAMRCPPRDMVTSCIYPAGWPLFTCSSVRLRPVFP